MLNTFLQKIGDFLATSGIKLVFSVLLLVAGWKLIGVTSKAIRKSKGLKNVDPGAKNFILSCVSVALKVILVLTVAANIGVPMTNIVAILGSCGLAVGLALQGGLANFAGGLMILIFHPFGVGDFIESSGKEGTVKSISLLYTVITTIDNKDVVMPNGALTNAIVTNYTSEKLRRVDLDFSVSYECDTERVKKVLLLICDQHELILKDPAPFARMTAHADSALIFTVRAWCKTEDYWQVRFDLFERVKDAFDKLNISIPYPQVDVHMR